MTRCTAEFSHEPASEGPPRLTIRIGDATRMLGIGRSKLYELINSREVETIKLGSATLIVVESIHAFIERRRASAAQ